MFIGERINNNNINIDTDKLAQDITSKINVPTIDTTSIVNPINTNTNTKHDVIITEVVKVNNIVSNTNQLLSGTIKTELNNHTVNFEKVSGSKEYIEDENKHEYQQYKAPMSLYNHIKHINAKVPDAISVQYTTWTVIKRYNDNTQKTVGHLPIKITILPRHMRIKIYNGIQLYRDQQKEDNIKRWELYLDNDHLMMKKFSNGDVLDDYMNELFGLYFFDGGSNSIPFPLNLHANNTLPPNIIDTPFYLYKDSDTNLNLHLLSAGVEAYNYQAILPQTIETDFLQYGSYDLV